MSYPPPIHTGDGPRLDATIRRADVPPELTYANGNTVRYLATGESTGGLFGLYRWEMGPGRSGPDPHFHRTISESFHVLSGVIQIFDGRDWVDTRPGDFAHVPPGSSHGFRNASGEPASMLLLFAPGAPREAYFEGLRHLAGMSDAERAEFAAAHDNFWL